MEQQNRKEEQKISWNSSRVRKGVEIIIFSGVMRISVFSCSIPPSSSISNISNFLTKSQASIIGIGEKIIRQRPTIFSSFFIARRDEHFKRHSSCLVGVLENMLALRRNHPKCSALIDNQTLNLKVRCLT